MNRLMFVYLSGSEKGKTRIFTQDHMTIGTSDACDLKLVAEEGGVLPAGVLADVCDDDGTYHLVLKVAPAELEITINGEEVTDGAGAAGVTLQDGDTLHFGHGLSSASVLFQVMPQNFSTAQIVRRNNREVERVSDQPVHPLTATLFVKELTAGLWAEIPRRLKAVIAFSVLGLFFLALAFLVFVMLNYHRLSNNVEQLLQRDEAAQMREQQYQDLIKKQQEEIDRVREISEQTRRFTQKVAEMYSPGVCLIVGSYTFVEPGTGRVLRYETVDAANETPVDQSGNLLASVEGAGPAVQIDYTGTGFVVDKGVIATNKHVVRPWATDPMAQIIMQQGGGFKPRLDALKAFFPSIQKPFALKELKTSERYDIALCEFDEGDAALPVLPLDTTDLPSIGEPVALLGYPTGVDGLLQRIEDESERRTIMREHGESAEGLAVGLAGRALIRPLTTTGSVTDSLPGRIVHSAQTTEGGSGSPMFNREGKVIAINSAILITADGTQSFGGSNFGVPIKVTYDMLLAYHKTEVKQQAP
jgi:S1-C subfamily serine protease